MIYLDTSAIAKLLVTEAESTALRSWLNERLDMPLVTSIIGRVELLRVVGRHAPHLTDAAHTLLEQMLIAGLTPGIIRRAETLPPPELRSLDALHLAAAIDLREDLSHLVTYDNRLVEAALSHGLPVTQPA